MRTLFFLFVLCNASIINAQVKQRLIKSLNADDSLALVSIATYPDSIRENILEACLKPDFIIQTEALQKSISQSFMSIMNDYNKEEQMKFWDLTRYPGLISKITIGEKKTKEELEGISLHYPEEIRPVIIEYGRKHYKTLVDINNLNDKSNSEFEKIIAAYPEKIKTSYRKLIGHPDALNILATNMHLSVILGNMYTADAKETLQMLDSIKAVANEQNAKDQQQWKTGIENNPEAKKEMEQLTREFINENENASGIDDVYNTSPSQTVPKTYTSSPTINYVVYPYPYWFGYPWWHDSPYWYPYPYWYNSGFYWGTTGVVFIGAPSPFFMHWYFFHPSHHYHYSHFSDYCIGYHEVHYGPRVLHAGFNSEIHKWIKVNEPNLPKGYFHPDVDRRARIKELGKFELDYHNNTKGVFGKNISRSDFLKNNADYYPRLKPVIKQPHFNKTIEYPKQQNPIKFNMGKPGNIQGPKKNISSPSQPIKKGGLKKSGR